METSAQNYLTTPVMTFTMVAITVHFVLLVILIGQIHTFLEN